MTTEMTRRAALTAAVGALIGSCATPRQGKKQQPAKTEPVTAAPTKSAAAVHDAEIWGRAIYDSYISTKPVEDPAVRLAIETAQRSVKDDCAPTYRTVAVKPAGAPSDRIVLFHIGEAPASQGMMLGRHYRIETSLDGKGVLLGEPSMTSCLTLPPAPDGASLAAVTHLLSPAPNEFHVFLTLLHKRALFVATEAGSWLVEDGKIRYQGS